MRPSTLAALAALALPALAIAGPLTPPAGPIAATHKTLSQLEPRTPISQATTPGDADSMFRITAPGSYYLTSDLFVAANKSGIEIGTYGVTIDLGGFAIYGLPNANDGITAPFSVSTLTVRNGRINGVYRAVEAWGTTLIEDVTVESTSSGIILYGDGSTVRRCRLFQISGTVVHAGGDSILIEDCTVDQSTVPAPASATGIFSNGRGTVVRSCVVTGRGGSGTGITAIAASGYTDVRALVERNHVRGFSTALMVNGNSTIRDNTVADAQIGIDLDGGGNLVQDNHINACGTGITASTGVPGDCAIRNRLRGCTTPLVYVAGPHDFAPAQTAANCTNPNANLVN